jgi:CRP/FNR family transcriptional regulator, anaerobic regulatory protein
MHGLDALLKSVARLAEFNDAELKTLVSKLEYREQRKNDLILAEGQIENHVYFIVEGTVRNYCLKDGDDVSLDFFFPGDFTNSYMSFLTRQKSIVNVEAMTEAKLLRLSYNDLQSLYTTSLSFNKLGRIISEQLYIKRTMQQLSFITMTASGRYEDLLLRHPGLVQQIPQKYLSTFLGISPETLSRLRSLKRHSL